MSHKKEIITSRHNTTKTNQTSYITGYILSVLLTIVPFIAVINHLISGWALTFTLLAFALVQVFVQLKFFIHLGYEQKPRWNWIVFSFMTLILLIIVIGSLWIMHNLDYNMMRKPDGQMRQDEGF